MLPWAELAALIGCLSIEVDVSEVQVAHRTAEVGVSVIAPPLLHSGINRFSKGSYRSHC